MLQQLKSCIVTKGVSRCDSCNLCNFFNLLTRAATARACPENFFGILGLLMHDNIESHLVEKRVFKPPRGFSRKARIKSLGQYRRMYRESILQPAKFWAREASELVWRARWKKVLEWKAPFAKWFVGGKLNISENCLDRHLTGPRRNKAAIIWEGEPGDKRTLTYQQLHRDVCCFANVLKRNDIPPRRDCAVEEKCR